MTPHHWVFMIMLGAFGAVMGTIGLIAAAREGGRRRREKERRMTSRDRMGS